LNRHFSLIRVHFSHPRPADISEHERVFECPVQFGATACQLVIARDVWDTPRAGTNPVLFEVLESHARMLLDQLPQEPDTVSRVRQAIEGELRGGSPKLETVARHLAMSPRTLQRRLKDEGVVFNDLLDHLRFRAAKDYLTQRDIAGSEVAYLLGFAEPSSFNHAFKRWSGQTPTEYRRLAGR
jgi:AraC-like DNA-binding protein